MLKNTILYIKSIENEYYGFITTYDKVEARLINPLSADMKAKNIKGAIKKAQELCNKKGIDGGYWFIDIF